MDWPAIKKDAAARATANLTDEERAAFTWERARAEFMGLPGCGLNIAHEALDRHLSAGYGDQLAIRWLGKDGNRRDITYAELAGMAARFANVLCRHGMKPGARVYALMGRVPELYAAALGTLKAGMTFTPLFAAFGSEPIRSRLETGEGNVLVTTEALYAKKVAAWRGGVPSLKLVLIAGGEAPEGCVALAPEMEAASDRFETARTTPEDMALIHFTSGTTGKPKGAVHVHGAVVAHAATGRFALDLKPGDIYWCTADPGWVTGTSYGIISPLVNRVTMIVDEAEFDLDRWYGILQEEGGAGLVYRADRDPHADAGRQGGRERPRFLETALSGQRRRALEPRRGDLGQGDVRQALPRQLVADRDRRRGRGRGDLPAAGRHPRHRRAGPPSLDRG